MKAPNIIPTIDEIEQFHRGKLREVQERHMKAAREEAAPHIAALLKIAELSLDPLAPVRNVKLIEQIRRTSPVSTDVED